MRSLTVLAALLAAVPVHGHSMGRTIPIGHSGKGAFSLAANVVASYFEEQMGRDTTLVEKQSAGQCIASLREREFPMAVLPEGAAEELPEDLVVLEKRLGPPDFEAVLVMGAEARKRLEFSLVPNYLDTLARRLAPSHWKRALERVGKGEGVRGVALDMLREADLL